MKHDLSFDPNSIELCSFFSGCISIQLFHLYSNTKFQWAFVLSPFQYFTKAGFSWQPWSGKTLPTYFVLSARSTKFLYLKSYVFFHGVCKLCKLLQRSFRRMHIQISKSTLHSLKSVFNVFTRKPSRGTQQLFSVKYLFCLKFILLEDG